LIPSQIFPVRRKNKTEVRCKKPTGQSWEKKMKKEKKVFSEERRRELSCRGGGGRRHVNLTKDSKYSEAKERKGEAKKVTRAKKLKKGKKSQRFKKRKQKRLTGSQQRWKKTKEK